MKILADENVHALVVAGLLECGWQVEWIAKTAPSTDDEDVLARADIAAWVLLTYDSDFGDLIFNHGKPTPEAVIFSKLERLKPATVIERVIDVLAHPSLQGHLVALTPDGNRFALFPGHK